MGFINRHALFIAPKRAFFDWMEKAMPELAARPTSDDPLDNDAATIYLIPEFDSPEDGMEWVEENFESFFEAELFGWVEDDELWPDMTWENFQKYFYISYQSMIENTVEGEIMEDDDEEFNDDDGEEAD